MIFVSGCWGLDVSDVDVVIRYSILTYKQGCAYVIASDLGSGAACSYDYCSMLPIYSGSTQI